MAGKTLGRQQKARILVVDDHPLIRRGLVEVVNRQPDMEVCAEAGSGREALEAAETFAPHLAVVDLALGDVDGLDLVKDFQNRHAKMAILILSRHEEAIYAERALRAGARGYVMKHERLQTVLDAIRRVLRGEVFLSDRMQSKVMLQLVGRRRSEEAEPLASLSDRELQVFAMIGRGMVPSDIARQLHLSVKTITTHKERIKEKLHLETAAELRRCAIELTQKDSKT